MNTGKKELEVTTAITAAITPVLLPLPSDSQPKWYTQLVVSRQLVYIWVCFAGLHEFSSHAILGIHVIFTMSHSIDKSITGICKI